MLIVLVVIVRFWNTNSAWPWCMSDTGRDLVLQWPHTNSYLLSCGFECYPQLYKSKVWKVLGDLQWIVVHHYDQLIYMLISSPLQLP